MMPRDSPRLGGSIRVLRTYSISVGVEDLLPSSHVPQALQTARDRRLDTTDGAIWTALLDHA